MNSANLLLPAPLPIARRKTSLTRTLWTDASSCILRKAKREASKEAALCCSPKEEKEARKEKAKAKGKAKESLERTWGIAKAKGQREKTLAASDAHSTTPVTFANCRDITRQIAPKYAGQAVQ